MMRYAVLSCFLICVLTRNGGAQTKATIDSTNVDGTKVTGKGKVNIDPAEVYVGTNIWLEDKDGKKITATPVFDPAMPKAGTTVNWGGTWSNVAGGVYTMVIMVQTTRGGRVNTQYDKIFITVTPPK